MYGVATHTYITSGQGLFFLGLTFGRRTVNPWDICGWHTYVRMYVRM